MRVFASHVRPLLGELTVAVFARRKTASCLTRAAAGASGKPALALSQDETGVHKCRDG